MQEFASTIWDELKRYINTVDRSEAAESLVNVLIDNDIDANDIRSAFAGDRDIKAALASYADDDVEEFEQDDEDIDLDDDSY
jgi:hypothetical protein